MILKPSPDGVSQECGAQTAVMRPVADATAIRQPLQRRYLSSSNISGRGAEGKHGRWIAALSLVTVPSSFVGANRRWPFHQTLILGAKLGTFTGGHMPITVAKRPSRSTSWCFRLLHRRHFMAPVRERD